MSSGQKSVRPRRVLAIHRYYWPDAPPYASMLRAIVDRWSAEGNQVEVLSTQPSYKPEAGIPLQPRRQRLGASTVRRIALPADRAGGPKRFLNVLVFPLLAFFRILLGGRRDVVMCSTSPPVTLGAAVSLAAKIRRSSFVYHCMDIHPEIGALSGDFNNQLVFRILQKIDIGTCRRADAVVVLSEDMRDVLVGRDSSIASSIHIINNFQLPDFASLPGVSDVAPPRSDDMVRIVFTGNLGRFQGLEAVVEAAKAVPGIELVFMGDGVAKGMLQQAASEASDPDRLVFLPHGTPSQARTMMRSADYGLVSLTPGIINFAYPSKTMSYLAEGLPLLVIVERNSQLARTVSSEGLGYTVDPGEPLMLNETLSRMVREKEGIEHMKIRASLVGERDFGQDKLLDQWTNLLNALVPQGMVSR